MSEKLFRFGNLRKFHEDEIIFDAGTKADLLPIIVSGKVKLVRFPELGKEVIVGIFQTGDIFAMPPVIDGGHYPATAIALGETKLLLLSRDNFLQLMKSEPELASSVTLIMRELLCGATATIQNLTTSSPEKRIATVLLIPIEKDTDGTITMRRQDIAEMAGLTTETTIRVIRKLKDKGLMNIIRGKIFFEQSELLRKFVR